LPASRLSFDNPPAHSPVPEAARLEAVITRGWNAHMVQVALIANGEERQLTGKEVGDYAAAESLLRTLAATHRVAWENVEMIFASGPRHAPQA